MSDIVTPSYLKKNSDKIKEALALLPMGVMSRTTVKPYIQFRLLDGLKSKFIAVIHYHDEHADNPGEGVNNFGYYFHSGVILPDGNVLVTNAVYEWRAVIMEYHGGWYITLMEGHGHRMPDFPVSPVLWGATIAGIDDDRVRSEITSRAAAGTVPLDATYLTLLHAVHEAHRSLSLKSPRHDQPSLVRFTT